MKHVHSQCHLARERHPGRSAKRHDLDCGRSEVQGYVGSLDGLGATKGDLVTTSDFSQLARDFVRHL